MSAHLIIMPVIIPLLAAVINTVLPPLAARIFSVASALACLFCVIICQNSLPLEYSLGNWAAPVGIALKLDALSALMLMLVNLAAAITISAMLSPAYTLLMLALAGFNGMLLTRDLFNLYVFLEISSLASYVLLALGENKQAPLAAFKYLVQGSIAASFYLIGLGILYASTGTLNFDDMAARLGDVSAPAAIKVAFGLMLIGVATKAALAPLHMWQPDCYSSAPDDISSFMASIASKIGLYVIIRLLFELFGYDYSFGIAHADRAIMLCGVVAMLIMSFTACYQDNIKRIFAYSSLAQTAAIACAIAIGGFPGIEAALVYIVAHGFAIGALFMAAACIHKGAGSLKLPELAGVARTMPFSTAALALAGLAVVGIPSSGMFVAKWLLLQASVAHDSAFILVTAIVISTLLSVFYWWRIAATTYSHGHNISASEAPLSMLIPCWIMLLFSYGCGIYTAPVIKLAAAAASMLSGGNAHQVAGLL